MQPLCHAFGLTRQSNGAKDLSLVALCEGGRIIRSFDPPSGSQSRYRTMFVQLKARIARASRHEKAFIEEAFDLAVGARQFQLQRRKRAPIYVWPIGIAHDADVAHGHFDLPPAKHL